MAEKKLKIGIIGCGGICRYAHVPAYEKMDNVEIVAACDIIPERAEEVARLTGAKHTFADYKELLKLPEIDAVDICTPNYLHSVIAVDAFAAGKHVHCEKPDAVSAAEQLKMLEAAQKAGKVLVVMRNNRFTSGSRFLKAFIDQGRAGEIYAARCGWVRRRGIPGKGGWFTTKAQSGGGPLIDLGVHIIDLTIWLMGGPKPVAVSASTYTRFADDGSHADSDNAKFGDSRADGTFDVEDLAMGLIRFDNGAVLQIEFSWASNIKEERRFIEARGTKAGFTWENGTKVEIFGEENGVVTDLLPKVDPVDDGHARNLQNFVDVLLNGAQPCYHPGQGQDMMKILDAVYESARLGREVAIH